jgi:hypothetical protein
MAKLCIMVPKDVFAADQSAVEQGEARAGHEQNEGGRGQHPGVVGIHLRVLNGLLESGDLCLCGRGRCGSLCRS